ncbi:MAG TPA: glycosyltransferase family 2 protein [Dehalococcoidia bacterium]
MTQHQPAATHAPSGSPAGPLVSVLTPSYNQARWLGDNLHSVACQTYPHLEHVVMDGGSTDGSVDLLRRHAGPHVRWHSGPDAGQTHALRAAFEASRGEVIGWLNSDDAYFDAGAVAAAVRLLDRHPEVDVVYGHAALVNGAGLILQVLWAPPFSRRLLRLHNLISQPAAFIRRRALDGGFLDPAFDYAMDRELWLRLAPRARFARLDRILAIDRHHPGRKAYTRRDLERADTARLVRTYGVPAGPGATAARKVLKVAFRLAGLRLLPEARRPPAFRGGCDSLAQLALRQIAVPRAAMPDGPAPRAGTEVPAPP